MTNDCPSQLDSSEVLDRPSIELTYPRILISTPFADLLSHSTSAKMTNESEPDTHDATLSESWASLSDADYSVDDELRSETTDAASLVDNNGPDDVHSLDDQTSDSASQDVQSEEEALEEPIVEGTKTPSAASVAALRTSRLGRPLVLEEQVSKPDEDCVEANQVIRSFNDAEVDEILGYIPDRDGQDQMVGRVCMTISKNRLNLDRPFHLLYIGNPTARPEILAKIGEGLTSGSEPQRRHTRLDSSRYHIVSPLQGIDSSSNAPNLIPLQTQIIVDDCTTAASIQYEHSPDHLFLSFKNGSLYSSRWNGTQYEITSASKWSSPDLAVFFLAQKDDSVSQQRHKLAHTFLMRHKIPVLIISESTSWESPFSDLPIDVQSPHLRIEAQNSQKSSESRVLRCLPINLETFECLESNQLSRNLECMRKRVMVETAVSTGEVASASSQTSYEKTPSAGKAVGKTSSKFNILRALCSDRPLSRTIVMSVTGLVLIAATIMAYQTTLAFIVNMFSEPRTVFELSPATTWSLNPSSLPPLCDRKPFVGPTDVTSSVASTTPAVVTSNKAAYYSLTTKDQSSDLAELAASNPLYATNKSENFQVHTIGDCDILIKVPRGFRVRSRSVPFDVIVLRGEQVLDSSLSQLFDGVYTVHVAKEQAYGVLNVTIRRHKSSIMEEHQVDFGGQWLKAVGWRKAAQIALDQVRNDLEIAQVALTAAYAHLSDDMQFRAKDISNKAARQAKKFSQQSRLFLNSTARLLQTKSNDLRHATDHERQEAYQYLSKRADLAFQALVVYAHTTNERGRAIIEKILASAGQTAERIQQNALQIDLADVQNRLQEYARSDRLATAQERAKQLVKDTSNSWKKRKALRKIRRESCGKRGRGCKR